MLHKYSIVQNLKEPMKATEIAVDIVFISFEKFPRECLHRPRPATLLKKRLWRRCFPVNFVKFLRTPFLQNTSGRLLLHVVIHVVKKLSCQIVYSIKFQEHLKLHGLLSSSEKKQMEQKAYCKMIKKYLPDKT